MSEDRDSIINKLAEGIANKALGISWYDTESQARRVATSSAEALYEVLKLSVAIQQSKDEQALLLNVKEFLDFIGVPV